MKRFAKFTLGFLGIILILAALYVFLILPHKVDNKLNQVIAHDAYPISKEVTEFHKTLRVADLHADTLLWKRNPAKRNTVGQTDMPRLRDGGYALQVFSAVTFVPANMKHHGNTMNKDRMVLLTFIQEWPARTWHSIFERARYQAQRLQKLERQSGGKFVLARTKTDLRKALEARQSDRDILIGILETEGAHPLEGNLNNIDKLYAEGYRMFGLQHFFDNALGGSLHGVSDAGLTNFGRNVVRKMGEKGIIIDLAHSSVKTVKDVLAMTKQPLLISHTGILSLCKHPQRNIPDRYMQEIADRGGLIGIGFWETANCDPTPDGIAKMLIYGAKTFGVDAIALGSDFDGAVTTKIDATEISTITDALLRQGMSKPDITKVMGENQIAFFLNNLPN
ncbi:MAG: dipeptidase [Robiginitomaculum sp.]